MTTILDVRGLVKSFCARRAVDSLSFEVGAGEVVALLGPNGSGKTTTIRCVAGLLRPDAGAISIVGRDARRDYRATRREMAYLPQNAEFPPSVTVVETVQFHAALKGALGDVSRAIGDAGFAEDDFDKPAGALSGGMRARLALAIASLGNPKLMLLDEPTANLDPEAAIRFRARVKDWRAAGRSVLMSTHVLTDVVETADRVIVLVGGRCAATESIADLRLRLSKYARLRVDVGEVTDKHRDAALSGGAVDVRMNGKALVISAPEENRLAILRTLADVGVVNRFETERPSIDDLYLEYVRSGSERRTV